MTLCGGIKVISKEEMFKIHQAAMRILQGVGLQLDISEQSLQESKGKA